MNRIDIYTIDIGGGHIAPAQAIKEQFDLLGYKDLDVRVVNVGVQLNARFLRAVYKIYWNFALRYPPLINAFYRGADNPIMMTVLDRLFGITFLPRFMHYLEKQKPDLVLSTYFTFTHYLEMFKRVGQLDAITVALNPEPFDAHFIWFSHAFDYSLVFSGKSRDEIVKKGISRRKVKVFPFPVKPTYAKRWESKEELRTKLELAREPFTFLFVFGAEGKGPVKKFLAALAQHKLDCQVMVVCGKNRPLQQELEELSRTSRGGPRIRVRGFVRNLGDYIAASDVVVGKSGPNQVFETLIQERPIIISSFLANEKRTSDWVLENRVGWLCRTPEQFARLAARIIAHPAILDSYGRNIRSLNLRSGTPDICAFLYDLLKEKRG
jgi:UDP-N-acetylglucosamine:LPS N-acetylglucosamine transferase